MVYKYKLDPRPREEVWGRYRMSEPATDEGLTGIVKGRKASSLEERFARALRKAPHVDDWWFDVFVETQFQIPGQFNRVDFFVWIGGVMHPIEIDGGWVHKSAEQKNHDLERDAVLDVVLKQRYSPVVPIERIPGYKCETQESADQIVREMM